MNKIQYSFILVAILGFLKFPFSSSINWKWNKDVSDIMERVANASNLDLNGASKFSKCHIVPSKFISDMVNKYKTSQVGGFNGQEMHKFVRDITVVHVDAA